MQYRKLTKASIAKNILVDELKSKNLALPKVQNYDMFRNTRSTQSAGRTQIYFDGKIFRPKSYYLND
jgi:hypothetical protein